MVLLRLPRPLGLKELCYDLGFRRGYLFPSCASNLLLEDRPQGPNVKELEQWKRMEKDRPTGGSQGHTFSSSAWPGFSFPIPPASMVMGFLAEEVSYDHEQRNPQWNNAGRLFPSSLFYSSIVKVAPDAGMFEEGPRPSDWKVGVMSADS